MIVNQQIFLAINSLAGSYAWLDAIGIFFAAYSEYVLVFLVSVVALKNYRHYGRKMFVFGFGTAIVSRFVIAQIIKTAFYNPRPFEQLVQTIQLIPENGSSMPSGHASFFFALAVVVGHYHRKLGRVLLGGAILMGIARIFVGVHWPLDIVVGATLGIIVGLTTDLITEKYIKYWDHK